MNMFDIIRQRNMQETEDLRAVRQNDPTYNRVFTVAPEVEVAVITKDIPTEVVEKVVVKEAPQTEVIPESEPKPKAQRNKKNVE